jgi:CBS domain-containing protein
MNEFDLPVSSHMVAPVSSLLQTERLRRAAEMFEERGVSALPVLDGSGRLAGVLERADLLRVGRLRPRPAQGEADWWWPDVSVAECMQTAVAVAPLTQPLRECAQRMLDRELHRVYVLVDNQLAGVVSTRELMLAVARAEIETPIEQLAVGLAEAIDALVPLSVASARFSASPGEPLVVVAGDAPIGVFAQPELRASLEADPTQPTRPYVDDRVISLPAHLAAHLAARRAIAARARYIIATDASGSYRVLSGLSFAGCVCGRRLPVRAGALGAVRLAPVVSVLDPGFRAETPGPQPRGLSLPRPVAALPPLAERDASAGRESEPPRNEPGSSRVHE